MKDGFTIGDEFVNGCTKKDGAAATIEPLVKAYTSVVGGYEEDAQTTLGDLLSDLHHWADVLGLDWDDATDTADMHYAAETDDVVVTL